MKTLCMKFAGAALVCLCIAGCAKKTEMTATSLTVDLRSSADNQTVGAIIEDIQTVELRPIDGEPIGQIDKLEIKGGHIAVLDSDEGKVFLFDRTGEGICTIDRQGRGPQEYLSAADMFLDEQGVAVFDDTGCKLLRYDLNGKFTGSCSVCEGYAAEAVGDGQFAVWSGYDADEYEISVFNNSGELCHACMEVDDDMCSLPVAFTCEQPMWNTGSELLFTRTFDYNVYSLRDRELRIKYTFDFGADNFDASTLQGLSPAELMKAVTRSEGATGIDFFVENDHWITLRAAESNILINKRDKSVTVLGNRLRMPFSALLSAPIRGYDAESGYHYTTLTASNILSAFVPFLSDASSGYPALDSLAGRPTEIEDNDLVVLLKLRTEVAR